MSNGIITNVEVLSKEHLPEVLWHRDEELQKLRENIAHSINTLIFGPVGSGKTTLVKRVVEDIPREDIRYVDCTLYNAEFSVLQEIMPSARLIIRRSTYELIKKLEKEVGKKRMWVCFDNFMRLKDVGVITRLMSLGINIILVSNVRADAEVLNRNVLSNIPSIVKMPKYSKKQSIDILKDRAEKSLVKFSYGDDLLEGIAERTGGNMMLAINLLRASALKADSKGKERMDISDIPETFQTFDNPGKLSRDELLLVDILREKGKLASYELFSLYRELASHPRGERSFRKYMERLCSKGLVKAISENRWRKYELVRNTEVSITGSDVLETD